MNWYTFISALCPDSSASRTVRMVLETWDHKLSWARMRKALHVFENMIMVLMPEQSYRQTRSSFKKRSTGLKAICKVGGNFVKIIYLFFFTPLGGGRAWFSLDFVSFTVQDSAGCRPHQSLVGPLQSKAGRMLIRWRGLSWYAFFLPYYPSLCEKTQGNKLTFFVYFFY